MSNLPQWITAIVSVLTLCSLWILRQQLKADHERSRRERAIELMKFWCEHCVVVDPFFTCGKRLVEEMSKEQCEPIHHGQELTIEPRHLHLLEAFRVDFAHRLHGIENGVVNDKPTPPRNSLTITRSESMVLRSITIKYLNHLETVATAWRHNVADRTIIEEEFNRIVSPKTNTSIFENYRHVSGNYPSIHELVDQLIEASNKRGGKRPIA